MRVYATWGAARLGRHVSSLSMAHACPFQFCTIDMMACNMMCAILSIRHFQTVVVFKMLLAHGSIDHAIVGGLSLGAIFAFHSALELEACLSGPRAVFALDAAGLAPL